MFDATDRRLTWVYVIVVAAILTCCLFAGFYYGEDRRGAFHSLDVDFSEGWVDEKGDIVTLPRAFNDGERIITLIKALPESLSPDSLMVVSSSYLPVKALIDEKEADVSGTFIDGVFGVTYANSRSLIQFDVNDAGKTIRLEMQCFGHGSKLVPEVYSVSLSSAAAIEADSLLKSEYTNIVVLAMIILGIVMMIMAAFLWFKRVRESCNEILLSALFLIICSLWFFTDTASNTVRYGYAGSYLFINLFSFLLIAAPMLLLIRSGCASYRRMMAVMSAIPVTYALLVALLLVSGSFKLSLTLTVSHAITVVLMMLISLAVVKEYFINGNKKSRVFLWCCAVTVPCGLATMLSFYCFCIADNTIYFRYGLCVITVTLAIRTISLTVTRAIDAKNLEKLRYAASHDSLTGIYNREAFFEKTGKMLASKQPGSHLIGSLDIERFSLLNDVFGREQGNDILVFIAKMLLDTFYNKGTYARLESDKFLFCFPESAFDVKTLCETLQNGVTEYIHDYNVTLCFGFYKVGSDALNVVDMVDRACLARETIKNDYTKRFAIYDDSLRTELLHKQNVNNSLDSSLENGDIWMALQPKFSFKTMHIDGAEALARWHHNTLGDISPASFIPVLEQNGLIIKLDSYIWEQAASTLVKWIAEFGVEATPPISINVSRMHLLRTNFVGVLSEIVARYGIPPHLMPLEITESVYSSDPTALTGITDELRSLGFKIHMDDFGSGYSSLNMLKNTNVDVIKLDMGFLMGGGDEKRSFEIIKAVVMMASAIGIRSVAEGVQTEKQVEMLKNIGCDEAQGHYFARAGTVSEVTDMVRRSLKKSQ